MSPQHDSLPALVEQAMYALCGVQAEDGRIGVAISGGADSVALLTALLECGFSCVVLHCNFGLRGEESDGDTAFVEVLCRRIGVECVTVRFDVEASALPGESFEMTCRRLRYDWFEEKAAELSLAAIALGHHADDVRETMLLNLLRGTGPRGLRGMSWRRGIYVRPMLKINRSEIENFLRERALPYRTDSTNLSTDYRRNALRIDVLPPIMAHFPGATGGMERTAANMSSAEDLISDFIDMIAAKVAPTAGAIDIKALTEMNLRRPDSALVLLSRKILPAGISESTADEVILCSGSGRRFSTVDGHPLELSRGILRALSPQSDEEHTVRLHDDIHEPISISVSEMDASNVDYRNSLPSEAWFDAAILSGSPEFTLRHWRHGDRIKPFGMKGSRLLSDIFSDMKLSEAEKRAQWLLCRDGVIVWIVGVRQADAFRINPATQRVLHLALKS